MIGYLTSCWKTLTLCIIISTRSDLPNCKKAQTDRFLRPEVPGFCPSKGLVGISFAWKDMFIAEDEGGEMFYASPESMPTL